MADELLMGQKASDSSPVAPGRTTVLVIPCYNEELRLAEETFLVFGSCHADVLFLLVDDASRDGTARVLERLAEARPEQFAVLRLQQHSGKAEAVRQGVLSVLEVVTGQAGVERHSEMAPVWMQQASQASFLGYWDADLATPLEELIGMRKVLESSAGVHGVMGSRVRMLGKEIRRRPWRHYVGRVLATVASWAVELPVYDSQCGAKLFRVAGMPKQIWQQPFRTRWLFDLELLVRWRSCLQAEVACVEQQAEARPALGEFPVVEYPVGRWSDVPGSKVRWWDGFRTLWELAALAWRERRAETSGPVRAMVPGCSKVQVPAAPPVAAGAPAVVPAKMSAVTPSAVTTEPVRTLESVPDPATFLASAGAVTSACTTEAASITESAHTMGHCSTGRCAPDGGESWAWLAGSAAGSGTGRSGLTLVELLVVISIIGLLIGLMLAAVQRAREAARRVQCSNNLKQIALALHAYHDVHRVLPVNMGPWPPLRPNAPKPPPLNGKGWTVSILPHVEQQALFDQFEPCFRGDFFSGGGLKQPQCLPLMQTLLPVFHCPSDGSARGLWTNQYQWEDTPVATHNYKGVIGDTVIGMAFGSVHNGSPDCHMVGGCNGLFFRTTYTEPQAFFLVRDGLSNTFMVGEDVVEQNAHSAVFYANADYASTHAPLNFFFDPPNPRDWPNVMSFRSYHPGGANFCMADGSVHFVADTIDHKLYQALSTKNGREAVTWPVP